MPRQAGGVSLGAHSGLSANANIGQMRLSVCDPPLHRSNDLLVQQDGQQERRGVDRFSPEQRIEQDRRDGLAIRIFQDRYVALIPPPRI